MEKLNFENKRKLLKVYKNKFKSPIVDKNLGRFRVDMALNKALKNEYIEEKKDFLKWESKKLKKIKNSSVIIIEEEV